MLSFVAAPSAPAKARGGDLSLHRAPADQTLDHERPLSLASAQCTYWPCDLLNAFILKMAATGRCVNTAMMLGHKPYAQQQLDVARNASDEALRQLAARLQTYFDAPPVEAPEVVAASAIQRAQTSTQTRLRPRPLAS